MLATPPRGRPHFSLLSHVITSCCRSDGTWAASTAHDRDPFHSQFGTDDDNYDNEVDPHAFTAAFFKTKTLEAIFKLWARDNMPDSFTMTADKFASKLAKFARDSARRCPLPIPPHSTACHVSPAALSCAAVRRRAPRRALKVI